MTPETAEFAEFADRPTPDWFTHTPFGIFIHWGAYSVPAWAEPIGALGTFPDDEWFAHNPYAEWYYNTIRIEGSPAQQHQRDVHGGAPYDDFLDQWGAEHFDPADWLDLFVRAGAGYVVPTTKHHDGIALWDAPGTGDRNTVHRGPRRDLIADIVSATRDAGLRVGLYYSGGLDWHVRPLPPLESSQMVHDTGRPKDAEYAAYAAAHVRDLMERYSPDVLWNDIEWPDEGKNFGPDGLGTIFREFYDQHPDGLVNDRWGDTHHDYTTSEYEAMLTNESAAQWENCRGIGWSFAYNQNEGPEHHLTGRQIARHLVDVVSRGGHFLLNVGPTADGQIPPLQRQALEDLAAWMPEAKDVLSDARPARAEVEASENVWVRTIDTSDGAVAFVDADTDGEVSITVDGSTRRVELAPERHGPAVIRLS